VTPISGVSALSSALAAAAPGGTTATTAATAATNATAPNFGNVLSQGLDHLQSLQTKSDDLAVKAATGDLTDVHSYTIAAAEANVATELTVAVRNKAVEAFNDVMRMPL